MKFDLIISEKLGHDIYVMANGAVYLKYAGNMQHIGSTGTTVKELRSNMEKYVCLSHL